MAKRRSSGGGLPSSAVASLGMDPLVAAVKSSASRKQWSQIIKRAHSQGLSVSGFLSNAPGPLKERLPSALRDQATQTIRTAYAPAEAGLNSQERRVQAIDDKRKNDNQSYLTWLNQQSDKLLADSRAADGLVADRQRQIQQDTVNAYTQLHSQAVTAAGQQQGVVSNPAQAAALDFSKQGDRAAGILGAQGTHEIAAQDAAGKHAAFAQANNFALIAAADAKRTADTWAALSNVADDRSKLKLQEGADTAKEVSRLLDQEITKAQSNRDFEAVSQKLGIQAQTLAFNKDKFSKQLGIQQSKVDLELRKFLHQARVDQLKLGLDQRKLDQADSEFQQNLQLGWYKARHPGTGASSLKQRIGNTNQDAFDAAVASFSKLTQKGKALTRGAAAKSRDQIAALLMSNLGVNRKIAYASVDAYIAGGFNDPGNFKHWIGVSKNKRPRSFGEPGARGN